MATTKTTLYIEFNLANGSKYSMPVDNPKTIGEADDSTTVTTATIKSAAEQAIDKSVIMSDGYLATSLERAYIRTVTDSDLNISTEATE